MTLRVQITKRADGRSVLKCVRADGTATWQRLEGNQAGFFPLHDLTHYAVESELDLANAFFGLIAQGWDIDDTTGKSARGPLPDEAIVAEHLVGMFDNERASGHRTDAEDINHFMAKAMSQAGRPLPLPVDDEMLERIRARRSELFNQFHALPPGGTLDLPFPAIDVTT